MSPVQQQRLAGAILLFAIISGVAIFLMTNAYDSNEDNVDVIVPIEEVFSSSIEMISEGDVEVVEDELETLLDPHNLEPDTSTLDVAETTEVEVTDVETVQQVEPKIENLETEDIKPIVVTTEAKGNIQTVEISWLLQLGSFSIADNAQKLQAKVEGLGFKAQISPVQTEKGTIYRLRIGPDTDKSAIEATALMLKNKLQLKSQLIQNK